MKKIINPCKCKVYIGTKGYYQNAYAEIEYEDGSLSIHGVIAPKSDGNCLGSCGQCIDEIRGGKPTEDWTDEMLQKFCDIWDRYHLNDMCPYCEHQKALNWDQLAEKRVTLYHYRRTKEAQDKAREAENAAIKALKNGETFTPTKEQVFFATLPLSITTHKELDGENAKYYEPKKPSYSRGQGFTEEKPLGWLSENEHPDGILGKACPVCGHKYGTGRKEEVPQDIIEWLFNLPTTKVKPAWV